MMERYPLLPLRDVVVFPYMVIPLFVGRPRSIQALEEAVEKEKIVFLAAQKDSKIDNPGPEDIYEYGTLGQIVQMLKLPDGTFKVLMEGKSRGRLHEFVPGEECFYADVFLLAETVPSFPLKRKP